MTNLTEKILACHKSLAATEIPYAFGGALALAWCTKTARATIDIDLNLFVSADKANEALNAIPKDVLVKKSDSAKLKKETQIRIWWDATPIDIFLNSTPYHEEVSTRICWERFSGELLPFLGCNDLAVFKAFYNRTKDWADIEAMVEVGTIDPRIVSGTIREYLGSDDERLDKLGSLASG